MIQWETSAICFPSGIIEKFKPLNYFFLNLPADKDIELKMDFNKGGIMRS